MLEMPGYDLGELLYESRHSQVWRGSRQDGLPVILKILNDKEASAQRRARFRQEYSLTHRLQLQGVITAYHFESYRGVQAMVLQDIGGTSLDRLPIAGALPLSAWLQLAIRMTRCLGQLHQQQVMHKDINPSNFIWNRHTGEVKLIDLGLATALSRELPETRHPEWIEGTLPYLSPEQTGRMNRAVDYRTDFYSLGVTFYELLTGQLPFSGDDALELVHAHIARQPVPVERIRPGIPAMLSAIIGKLMGKTAEERYQSVAGLMADLQTCLRTLDDADNIPVFTLGSSDVSERLQISQKLYGREHQVATLLAAFERARHGPSELLLVTGYSGIGKSALVHEIQKPITERRGYFIEGKFDQLKRAIPYVALVQALTELVRQLLTEDENAVMQWRAELLQALGKNGQVIIDVIPDVGLLIGPQPAVPKLPPDQAQNRFNHEFRKFVGVFAALGHPLVLFLDDLQWADLPSLQLMSLLLRAPALPHVLLIGAYRDNEVTPDHPLSAILKEIAQQGASLSSVTLAPLAQDDVHQLLCDTLRADTATVDRLARLCVDKTQGNPFFLKQFLRILAEDGMVRFDATQGHWQWEINRIEQAGITDNIVELMVAKLHKLPLPTQQVLQAAACLGGAFDLRMLALICERSEASTGELLWDALREELVVPLEDRYQYVGQSGQGNGPDLVATYRFRHDRIQQAAYLLGSAADKPAMHLAIGRLWLQSLPPAEQQARLFEWVNHFNLGRHLIADALQRQNLARLNLDAARRAKASAAYKPALGYAQIALELVSCEDWKTHYDLMLALHLEAAEVAYLCAGFEQMECYLALALQHARDVLDQAKAYEIRIQAHLSEGRPQEAVAQGLQVLDLLGVSFPGHPARWHVIASVIKTQWALRGKSMEQLASLPTMTDPHMLAVSNLLHKIGVAAYFTMPMYFPLLLCKAIDLSLQYGHGPGAATNCAGYGGMILRGIVGDIKQSIRFGELALRLQERPEMAIQRSPTLCLVHGYIQPWKYPLRKSVDGLRQSYLTAMASGDTEYAANAASLLCYISFHCGNELEEVEKEFADYVTALTQRPSHLNAHRCQWQLVQNLRGDHPDPTLLQGTIYDAHQLQEAQRMTDDQILMFRLASCRLFLFYLFRRFREAHAQAVTAARYVKSLLGSFGCSQFYFYDSLAHLALLGKTRGMNRIGVLRRVKKNQKKLQHWAKHGPENFRNKWMLVEAELARHRGEPLKAIDCYEQAIRLAADNGYMQEEALAQELAGEFYLERGQETLARVYLKQAQQSYLRWGALAKVNDLAQRYPRWLRMPDAVDAQMVPASRGTSVSHAGTAGMLDFAAITKASQALSQEIVLENLLKRLMQVVIENAGAQRGMVLLKKDERWFLEASQTDEEAQATVLQSVLVDESTRAAQLLPLSLVRYVTNTRQSVVIDDATQAKLVAQDTYVQTRHPRSLLMLPILHQRELTGLLYLENNAVTGAFAEHRLQVLQLLASQTAISIENARLYAYMEERVVARTMELTRFLAVASHDLRQPMHALNLYLGAFVNYDLPEPVRPLLADVRQCAQILNDMFLALLDISRLDARVVQPHQEVFPIASLLARIRVEFEPQARAKGLCLRVAPCTAFVHSDRSLVERILRNFVTNAVRYTERGTVLVGCRRQGRRLRLAVYDTGIGIAPDEQRAVFDEFYQAGNRGRDRANGLGLGLAIVRRLARLLSTPLTLVSKPGQGSMFSIDLPQAARPGKTLAQSAVPLRAQAELADKFVLVVDDEKTILDAMRVLLQQWGCIVLTATSGQDALQQLGSIRKIPDGMICDYRLLDGETGLHVVQALHVEFNEPIPALLITGDTTPELIRETLASGLPVLHKPIQATALREALEQLLHVSPQSSDMPAIEPGLP
ncbi:AAA family ATPase [Noviherbaspirillum sp.]|jgi:predicted ATPase/signal transduction histidine kinase/ActR/RegA family two-component response regulator|uniref:ATP-binding response regulator n=1 Tax=Noviherbaspirillum sp. TaxID=1926288 RepID=UPI0025CD0A79|nr:AAA family ATPase [Noviherbaspirillum sp.]